jgi:hypothetical protein
MTAATSNKPFSQSRAHKSRSHPKLPFDADGEAVIQLPSNWPNSRRAATANAQSKIRRTA